MSFSADYGQNVSVAGISRDQRRTVTFTSMPSINGENIPDSSDGLEVQGLDVDQSQMVFLWIESDQDLTIYTNADAVGGDDTINVSADVPIAWDSSSDHTNPITTDITGSIFVDNSSGSAATLYFIVGQDPTA